MKGLEGIKIVELTGYVAAPAALRILAEMGATVYKVEPFSGDEYRTNGPGFGMGKTDIDDPAFDLASMNKEFLSVNLKDPDGAAFLEKLLADADIMVTSFRDSALKKLGLDYESVHARHPHLVWGQMRGYGEYGPERDSRGYDTTCYAARGGFLMSLPQSGESFQPTNWPAAVGDWNASMALTAGLLGALVRKDRTGEGDKVTVSLHHCALWAMQIGLAATQFGDVWPKSRYNVTCPTNNTYRSRDGVWFIICFGSYDMYYELTMRAIDLPEMVGDERYDTAAAINDGSGRNTEVVKIMEAAFAKQDWDHWERVFRENEIPFQRLFTLEDVLEDEEAYANDALRRVQYDAFGEHVLPTSPVRFESMGDPVLHRGRPVGYDTARIMGEYGYTPEQIAAMNGSAVKLYEGPELPDSVTAPNYGPRSIRE
ncbi:MAG: CaiB/BaiF CoA transferase family protein [Eggerthellaceae bacterium]